MVQIAAALDCSVSELFRHGPGAGNGAASVASAPDGDGLVLTNKLFSIGMTRGPTKSVLEAALPVMRPAARDHRPVLPPWPWPARP